MSRPRPRKDRKDQREKEGPGGQEIDLLARFREGDEAAFEELVGRFQDRLIQFFYRLCWDRDRAEDLTQELFMKLLRGAFRYRPQGRLSTFVFRVATNLWIDHYRAMRPQPRLYSLDQPLLEGAGAADYGPGQECAGPIHEAIASEQKARLRRALSSLTEPHRLVFELAVYQQLPYGEIAEVLDIPVGTVKSRMHNSVKALKGMLAEEGSGRERPFRAARGEGGRDGG